MQKLIYAVRDLSATDWLLLLGLVILFHGIWFACTVRTNPLIFLVALFSILSPLSGAIELPGVFLLKIGRIYVISLIILTGILLVRRIPFSPAVVLTLSFAIFYWIAAIWSDEPAAGITYKAHFLMTFVAGILLGLSFGTLRHLPSLNRFLSFSTLIWFVILITDLSFTSKDLGRWSPHGMNPNTLAMNSAGMATFVLFAALYDRNPLFRVTATVSTVVAGATVLLTGSRASTLALLMAGSVIMLPLLRRPLHLFMFVLIAAAATMPVLASFDFTTVERLTDFSSTNRRGVWAAAIEQFSQSPIIGSGWYYTVDPLGDLTTVNAHSVYLQTLAELGLVGALMLFVALLGVVWSLMQAVTATRGAVEERNLLRFIIGWLLGFAALSAFETTLNQQFATLTTGFCLATLARLRERQHASIGIRDVHEEWLPDADAAHSSGYPLTQA